MIENEKAKAKSAAKNAAMSAEKQAKRRASRSCKKPPEGTVVWTEQTFDKLVAGVPEQLMSRMKVDNAMLVNVAAREEDAFPVMRRLLTDNHEDRRSQLRLARRALRLATSLVQLRRAHPARRARRARPPLRADRRRCPPTSRSTSRCRTSRWPRSTCSTRSPTTYTLDIVSVVEAVLEAPRQILFAQQHAARGEAIAEMKADGLEYDERMALLDEITWPQPLRELLEAIVRDLPPEPPVAAPRTRCAEVGRAGDVGAGDELHRLRRPLPARPVRGAGAALPHRRLPHAAPDRARRRTAPPELEDLIEWLGETVRQTDSSLLDEWEALSDPDHVAPHGGRPRAAAAAAADLEAGAAVPT